MKRFFKVIGVLTGIYLIFNTLCLAFMGWVECMSHLKEANYNPLDAIDIAWDEVEVKLKKSWNEFVE